MYLKTRYRGYLARSGTIARPHFEEKSGATLFDAIILPDSNVFFLLYQGTAHGSIGTRCRTFSALQSFTVFENGYLTVIACDNCDSVRDGRHA